MNKTDIIDSLGELEVFRKDLNEYLSKRIEAIRSAVDEIHGNSPPNFSFIKDGEHFYYHGLEFVRLGLEYGGVLCIAQKTFFPMAFDYWCCNNWRLSSARKLLNGEFATLLDDDDFLVYVSDLTTIKEEECASYGGCYGECRDKVGIISVSLFLKYRQYMPEYDTSIWTCTPKHYSKDSLDGKIDGTKDIYTINRLGHLCSVQSPAYERCALAPVCVFKIK